MLMPDNEVFIKYYQKKRNLQGKIFSASFVLYALQALLLFLLQKCGALFGLVPAEHGFICRLFWAAIYLSAARAFSAAQARPCAGG